jgi:hypothetical protein
MKKIEEVIDFLKSKEKLYSQMDESDRKDYVMECLDTAIKMLSTEKTDEDLVSRQAVLDLFGDIHPLDYNNRAYVSMIKELPSAGIKPIVYGEWIRGNKIHCSNCNKSYADYVTNIEDEAELLLRSNYCPFCGADMKEESEKEWKN